MQARKTYLVTGAMLASLLSLAACNPQQQAGVERRVEEASKDVRETAADSARTVAGTAKDATITTKVNAALAADDQLKAVRINVDTANGKVTLNGTAPDAASRERATVLAKAVDGVVDVDNRLQVGS